VAVTAAVIVVSAGIGYVLHKDNEYIQKCMGLGYF